LTDRAEPDRLIDVSAEGRAHIAVAQRARWAKTEGSHPVKTPLDRRAPEIVSAKLRSGNDCPELQQLKKTYDLALIAWENRDHATVVDGHCRGAIDPNIRKRLLRVRLEAATNLYNHTLACPKCKARLD
jgi:hypothetical protein